MRNRFMDLIITFGCLLVIYVVSVLLGRVLGDILLVLFR